MLYSQEAQGPPDAAPNNGGTHPSSRDSAARTCARSSEDYRTTSFPGPDRAYRDGALVGAFFLALRQSHSLYPSVETRMRLSPDLVLIPDVAVFHPAEPENLPDRPPLITIEVLSADDRMNEARAKLGEYRTWGVPRVWLVNPHSQRFYVCDAGLHEVESLAIPEMQIELTKAGLFG